MPYRRRRRRFVRTRWALLTVLGIVVIAGLLVGWRAYHVRQELDGARTAADVLRNALEARDAARARAGLDALRLHSSAAAEQTDGPLWSALTHSPVVGDDAEAVAEMSTVLDSLARNALGPAVDVVTGVADGSFSPQRGRIPVERIEDLQEPVERASGALEAAASDIDALDGSYVGQVSDARDQLADTVADARSQIRTARKVVDVAPDMLGASGPRTYLLVLQNNAEVRATGGFPGSMFVLTVDDGRISLGESFAPRLTEVSSPVLPLTPAELSLFGVRVGTRFVDAGRQPDFARVAALWRANLQQREGLSVDGLISMDPVTLSYLMEGLDPIQVDGISLTSNNVVHELLNNTYLRLPDAEAQDQFFRSVGTSVLDVLLGAPDPEGMVRALQRGAEEGRVLMVSDDATEERVLESTPLAGAGQELRDEPDTMGVFLSDQTRYLGSKLSYYLSSDVTIQQTCGGAPQATGELSLSSSAPDPATLPDYIAGDTDFPPAGQPADVVPRGTEEVEVVLVPPAGSRIAGVAVDGSPVNLARARYDGRAAVRLVAPVAPGGLATVSWRLVGAEVGSLVMTPGIRPGAPSVRISTCG